MGNVPHTPKSATLAVTIIPVSPGSGAAVPGCAVHVEAGWHVCVSRVAPRGLHVARVRVAREP